MMGMGLEASPPEEAGRGGQQGVGHVEGSDLGVAPPPGKVYSLFYNVCSFWS